MLKSRNLLGILAAILLAIPLIAACGGDDGGNGNPTPTSTIPASNGGDQTPTGNNGQTEPYSDTANVFTPPLQFGEVKINLKGGDVLKFSFVSRTTVVGAGDTQAHNRGTGAGVVMAINDPFDDQLLLTEQTNTFEGELTAELDGEYNFIFQNPSILEGNIVDLTYSVNS